MSEKKNIYFASDMHLGMHPPEDSRKREKIIVSWMDDIKSDAKELWLLGDIFDYWFDYRKVIPRGFTRFLGKLAELSDSGIRIHMFPGNHDVWLFDYFPEEFGIEIHQNPVILEIGNKTFYLHHGDGLTPKDKLYLLIKAMFRSKFLQWCYARIHPNGSAAFAQWWSKKSRYGKEMTFPYKGDDKEEQILYSIKQKQKYPEINLFIYGHRHIPYDVKIQEESRVICLGDWIDNFSYGVFDGEEFQLKKYTSD